MYRSGRPCEPLREVPPDRPAQPRILDTWHETAARPGPEETRS
jgi:hypothetical protein